MSLLCRSCRFAQCRKPVKLPQVQYLDMVVLELVLVIMQRQVPAVS